MRLEDKIAIVTGGASGIGRATALRFAAEGARVVVADMNGAGAEEAAREIQGKGGEALAVACDVTVPDQVERVFQTTRERYGRLDALFCSAGVAIRQRAMDADVESWDKVFDINVRGLWLCAKHALEMMIPRESGSIIFVASAAGLVGVPDRAAYCASKGGVIGLMRSIVHDYSQHYVRCNCICPGAVVTPINADYMANLEKNDPEGWAKRMYHPPIPRFGSTEDMANAALFLASDESSYVSGVALAVDGGLCSV